jgi:Tfp pilus assembly protein PilO
VKLPFDLRALWERALKWYRAHSEREQRVILGVVVASIASLVYIGVVEPVLDYRKAVAQEISDGQEELERSLRFLAAKDTLRAERDELRKKLAAAKTRLLPGGTATLGAAALQERTNAIATDKGITPQSTQVMKEEAADPYRKVSVRLTLSGELKPLADLVTGLEYGQQLSVPFIEISRRGAVAGAKGPRTLSVTMEVSGFVQGSGKPQASEAEEAAAAVAPAPEGAAGTPNEGPAAPGTPPEAVAEAGGGETPPANGEASSTTTTAAASSSSSSSAPVATTTTATGSTTSLPKPTATTMPRPTSTTMPPRSIPTLPPGAAPIPHPPPPAPGQTVPPPIVPHASAPTILGQPPGSPAAGVQTGAPPAAGVQPALPAQPVQPGLTVAPPPTLLPPNGVAGAPQVPVIVDVPPVQAPPQVLGRPPGPPPGGDDDYEEDTDE